MRDIREIFDMEYIVPCQFTPYIILSDDLNVNDVLYVFAKYEAIFLQGGI